MAIATIPEGSSSSGIKDLNDLYSLIAGTKTSGGGGTQTTTSSGGVEYGGSSTFQDAYTDTQTENSDVTTTSESHIDQAGLDAMLKNILEGTSGLAAVSAGQRGAGGYNSSVNTLLTNDLLARAAGQVAQNNKTSTSNVKTNNTLTRNVGARTSNTITQREIPSTTNTVVTDKADTKVGGNTALGYLMGGMSAYEKLKKLKLFDSDGTKLTSDNNPTSVAYRNEMDKASDAAYNSNSNAVTTDFGTSATDQAVGAGYTSFASNDLHNFGDANLSVDNYDYAGFSGLDAFSGFDNFGDFGSLDSMPVFDNDVWGSTGDFDYLFGADSGFDWSSGLSDLGFNLNEVDWSGLGNFSFADGGLVGKSAMKQHFAKQVPMKPKGYADGGRVLDETGAPVKRQNNVLASQSNTILDPRSGVTGGQLGYNEANMGQYAPVATSTAVDPNYAKQVKVNPITQASNTGSGGMSKEEAMARVQEIIAAKSEESAKQGKEGGSAADAVSGNISSNPSATAQSFAIDTALSVIGLISPPAAAAITAGKAAFSIMSLLSKPDVEQSQPLDTAAISEAVNSQTPVDDGTTQSIQDTIDDQVSESAAGNGDGSGTGTNGSAGDANGGDGGTGATGDGSGSGGGTASAADGGLIASLMSEEPTAGKVVGAGSEIEDKVNAKLSPNEYVLPADVVDALGIDNLDKLVKKYHTPAAVQRAQAKGGR